MGVSTGRSLQSTEGEKLVTIWFIEKNNPPVQPADKWGPRCFLQPALRLEASQKITDAKTSSLPCLLVHTALSKWKHIHRPKEGETSG